MQARIIELLVVESVATELERPATQRLMLKGWDMLALEQAKKGGDDRALRAERRKAETAVERLVGAIARGTLEESEAAAQLAAQRRRITDLDVEIAQAKTLTPQSLAAEREKYRKGCIEFPNTLRRAWMTGLNVREVLRPWIDSITVDKGKGKTDRNLAICIRRLPDDATSKIRASAVQSGRDSP
jgi:hypothetical protein